MIRIGIAGIGGRMGQEILSVARAADDLEVVFGVEQAAQVAAAQAVTGASVPIVSDLATVIDRADVLIDFTTPAATITHAEIAARVGKAIVAGTTGLSSDQLAQLQSFGSSAPIFYSRNMSIGIHALVSLLPALVDLLDGYDIEIVETHHRHKVDAPSGTAVALAEAIASALPRSLDETATYGRHGIAPRQPGEIGIHAVRGGGNAGEHTVIIANDGEEIRLSHRSFSRRTFAIGAVRVARFMATKSPGFYTMADFA